MDKEKIIKQLAELEAQKIALESELLKAEQKPKFASVTKDKDAFKIEVSLLEDGRKKEKMIRISQKLLSYSPEVVAAKLSKQIDNFIYKYKNNMYQSLK